MAQAGATLQNYNNDLVRCARHTLAHAAKSSPLLCHSGVEQQRDSLPPRSRRHRGAAREARGAKPLGGSRRGGEGCERCTHVCRQCCLSCHPPAPGQMSRDLPPPPRSAPSLRPLSPLLPPPLAAKIQNDLRILTERLARINDNLALAAARPPRRAYPCSLAPPLPPRLRNPLHRRAR